ncbi:hypothetical protein [Massilia sp. TWP1-3-3]|uniref:hypothetical protein n=1 Tax=Massilia sp. TWP1-3-3 TaxID=2804573 RepID=UPI003CF3FB42
MPHRVTQPTKEQVRAYMVARETARRPPPPPEEIRRQLGWRLQRDDDRLLFQFYLIPTTYTQMATRLTLEWMLAVMRPALVAAHTRENLL